MILYCVLTSAVNSLASMILALAVFWKKPRGPANLPFSWFAVTGALWSGFYFAWQTANDYETAFHYARLLTASAILIPIAYFHFATRLLEHTRRIELQVGYVLAAILAGLSLWGPWLIKDVEPRAGFPFWPVPGLLYPFYLLDFAVFFIVALKRLTAGYRESEGLRRNQLRLVTLGTAIGFFGGATNFLLWYKIPVPPIGNGLVAVYVIAVGYAIIRFRLMDFDLLAARAASYLAVTCVFALLMPVIMYALARLALIPGMVVKIVPLFLVSFIVTGFLIWIAPAIRRRIDSFLEQRVLGDRMADRELLRNLAARISSAENEQDLFDDVVQGVTDALSVGKVAVFTRTEFETDFIQRSASAGWREGAAPFLERSPLVGSLQDRQISILLDEAEHSAQGEMRSYFVELRRKQGIELVVPIVGDTFFYGFLTLGPRRGHALFNDVDVSLLEAIGLQIGLSLRARQLERRASQTEKLISLGTLAAGLAHELRNPLTSIQTFSALMKERSGDADFQLEFGAVVQRDVNRIASIVENVAAFAESNKVEMTAVQLPDVLRTVSEIVRPESQRTGAKVVLSTRHVPPVRGNHSQLLQVFLNLVQNAQQAMEGRPEACITLGYESRLTDASTPMVCVTVVDNGPGIDPALLPHIFEPFTTTKATGERRGKHGMGLGLAIVRRIVQHHHGEINVTSQLGRGTTFRVYLPQYS